MGRRRTQTNADKNKRKSTPVHPGEILVEEFLKPMGISQYWNLKRSGRAVDRKIFEKLVKGKIFPGAILHRKSLQDHWWDDFTDVYHQYPIAKEYHQLYGDEFIKARKIVVRFLEQEIGNLGTQL